MLTRLLNPPLPRWIILRTGSPLFILTNNALQTEAFFLSCLSASLNSLQHLSTRLCVQSPQAQYCENSVTSRKYSRTSGWVRPAHPIGRCCPADAGSPAKLLAACQMALRFDETSSTCQQMPRPASNTARGRRCKVTRTSAFLSSLARYRTRLASRCSAGAGI